MTATSDKDRAKVYADVDGQTGPEKVREKLTEEIDELIVELVKIRDSEEINIIDVFNCLEENADVLVTLEQNTPVKHAVDVVQRKFDMKFEMLRVRAASGDL